MSTAPAPTTGTSIPCTIDSRRRLSDILSKAYFEVAYALKHGKPNASDTELVCMIRPGSPVLSESLTGSGAKALVATSDLIKFVLLAVRKIIQEETIRTRSFAYLAFARRRSHLYELLLIPCATDSAGAVDNEALGRFVADHVITLAGPHRFHEASVALFAFPHGIAQLEGANLFGNENHTPALSSV